MRTSCSRPTALARIILTSPRCVWSSSISLRWRAIFGCGCAVSSLGAAWALTQPWRVALTNSALWRSCSLAGAGLTYGAALNNISEKEQLQLTLYRCGDALAAYTASKEIIVEYATGKATISQIDLDGAKSSLAYSIISSTANKPQAVASQWAAGYTGVQADYTSWLLSQVPSLWTFWHPPVAACLLFLLPRASLPAA